MFSACPPGFIGPECHMTCDDCQHGARCDIRNGRCLCPPGWSGLLCHERKFLTGYGTVCQKSEITLT